jgi:hypothetical protein
MTVFHSVRPVAGSSASITLVTSGPVSARIVLAGCRYDMINTPAVWMSSAEWRLEEPDVRSRGTSRCHFFLPMEVKPRTDRSSRITKFPDALRTSMSLQDLFLRCLAGYDQRSAAAFTVAAGDGTRAGVRGGASRAQHERPADHCQGSLHRRPVSV